MEPDFPKLRLMVFLLILVNVTSDYVRPLPREDLEFPWNPKPSSEPQQVTLSSLIYHLYIYICIFFSFWVLNISHMCHGSAQKLGAFICLDPI